ncbi:MAG TPA: hypothetical protein DDZ80_30285 [Cyanobacteria bacterium UBA8803]|nr:hypothetical protein [Cyanobacteria bacterium UBA9273]HBL62522.1 hypothetical protein [Cyanobacteria bacterium UBA8803]
MKLQRTTWGLLFSALLLGGLVYVYEMQKPTEQETAKATQRPIFSFKQDQVQLLTIYLKKDILQILKFERASTGETSWQMKYPKEVAASDAAIAFLLDLLAERKSDRTLTKVSADQLKEYGLDEPQATVKVELKDRKIHRLMLGKPDFNRNFLYAQVDPPPKNPEQSPVLLVPIDFEYAVNRPLSEWQQSKKEDADGAKPSDAPQEPSEPTATP